MPIIKTHNLAKDSIIIKETNKLLDSFKSQRHIVNLGHGVYPDVDPEKVKILIKTVKDYEIKYN